MGSRLDLSFATANFPEDYLPYTSSYSRNKEPYLVWDNSFNGHSTTRTPIDGHYHLTTSASVDSHSPASLNHYHLQSHNHLYPTCSASSASWPSSKRRRCCGLSCGCCAISIIAFLIISALATVVGFSIYLAMITNLHKSSLIHVSGSLRVDKGDDYDKSLSNSSSPEFMAKAAKYETIIKTAIESSDINSAIVKQEVYAFRKGSLIVFFRIYLDRRKMNVIIDSETKDEDKNEFAEAVAVKLLQRELREGVSQLKITGNEQIIIDTKSIHLFNEFDTSVDHNDVNDIKTSGIVSNKASTHGDDPNANANALNNTKPHKSSSINPTKSTVPTIPSTTSQKNTQRTHSITKTTSTTTTTPFVRIQSSVELPTLDISSNKITLNISKSQSNSENSQLSTTAIPKSTVKSNTTMPFTRRQSTASQQTPSTTPSTPVRITTRPKLRPTTPLATQEASSLTPSQPTVNVTKLPAVTSSSPLPSTQSHNASAILKKTEFKDEGLKISSLDFGEWKPVTPPQLKPQPKPTLPPPKPTPHHQPVIPRPPPIIPPLLKPPPRVGLIPPHLMNRPGLRIPIGLPIPGFPMRELPRLLDDSEMVEFNISLLNTSLLFNENNANVTTISSQSDDNAESLTERNNALLNANKLQSTSANPTMVDGFIVPVSVTLGTHSVDSSLRTPLINSSDQLRDLRKNKQLTVSHEKPTTKSSTASLGNDSSHSSVSSSSPYASHTHSTDPSIGSPIIYTSQPLNNENVNEKLTFIAGAHKHLKVDSPLLEFNQTIELKRITDPNWSERHPKTKTPFDYASIVSNDSLFNVTHNSALISQTFTTSDTPISSTFDSIRVSATASPLPPINRISTSTSPTTTSTSTLRYSNSDLSNSAGIPIGLDLKDPNLPQRLIRQYNDSNGPVFGERLPKFIPPALFQKLPNNDIINVGVINNDDADEALYDDEIASINQTSIVSIVSSISSFASDNNTTTSHWSETTTALSACSEAEFECGSGECIPVKGFCNRRVECADGSDELNCTCANYLRVERQFRKLCDGIVDCHDASDEINCPYCKPESYVCNSGNICVDKSKICNGDNDCPNGDDESECIALVNDYREPETIGKYLSSEGALFIRQKGEWAPLCLDNLNMPVDLNNEYGMNAEDSWKVEDLGKAICRANSYYDLVSVGFTNLVNYKSGVYFKLAEPSAGVTSPLTMWSSLFKKSVCATKRTTYVKCDGIECGVRPLETNVRRRIVGGQSASMGSWPWQAALYREGEFQCGGVIINSQWLLTAAHCFHATRDSYWTARIGILRRGNSFAGPHEQVRRITHVIIHPEYVDKGFINDIALLRLSEPFDYSKHVRPICLPSESDDVSKWHKQLCTTIGWGKLFEHGRIFPDTLQEVRLPVISTEECRKRTLFLPLYKITDNMFCAGFERGGRDACLGDSGGPMMCQKRDGKWFLLGVTSNGDGCGRAGRPGVYTKVANYMSWIEDAMNDVLPKEVDRVCSGIRCPLGRCLGAESICNGIIDCRDGSDERNCTQSRNYSYMRSESSTATI